MEALNITVVIIAGLTGLIGSAVIFVNAVGNIRNAITKKQIEDLTKEVTEQKIEIEKQKVEIQGYIQSMGEKDKIITGLQTEIQTLKTEHAETVKILMTRIEKLEGDNKLIQDQLTEVLKSKSK